MVASLEWSQHLWKYKLNLIQMHAYAELTCLHVPCKWWANFLSDLLQFYNSKNTIMFDDLRRNFVMNPQNGLTIKPFRKAHANRDSDRELVKLTQYLLAIADLEDISVLDHKHWETYNEANSKRRRHSWWGKTVKVERWRCHWPPLLGMHYVIGVTTARICKLKLLTPSYRVLSASCNVDKIFKLDGNWWTSKRGNCTFGDSLYHTSFGVLVNELHAIMEFLKWW